ncbi:PadR family transcriptional regulator [Nocardioides sp. 503]|uniref:PadR family transcriptional regulator n=1 Tax=Nocardioides sp. 503 TaxID=2508326 RepID=UPI00142FDBDC|nr:PadR family transcriptional regulator [Nocardioides sp. 503]
MLRFRMTRAAREILLALAEHDPAVGSYGNELARETGLAVGTVYPLLTRLQGAGVIYATWEDVDPRVVGRPAIRYWRFTAEGAEFAEADRQAQLARLQRARVARPGRPAWDGGST